MGMDSSTIYGMLPVGKRKAGVVLDASITSRLLSCEIGKIDKLFGVVI